MSDQTALARACNKIADQIDEASCADADLLESLDRLRGSTLAAETRMVNSLLFNTVPGIAAVRWQSRMGESTGGARTISLREIQFLDQEGGELYGHTLSENMANFDVRFTRDFASKLFGLPATDLDGVDFDLADKMTDLLDEAFSATRRLAVQEFVLRGGIEGGRAVEAPKASIAAVRFANDSSPGCAH